MKKSLTIFALLLSLSVQLFAQKTWTGATSTAWNTSTNWNPAGVPTSGEDVTIPVTTNQPLISGTTTPVCNNLIVNSGATLTISGTSTANAQLTIAGTATFNGQLSIGGSISKTGKLATTNIVWNSPSSINAYFNGRMEVSGNYTFASGSSINLGWCWLTFTGGSNSHIYNHSASSSFSSVTLSKTGSAVVYIDNSSTATLTIDGTLSIGAGSVFIGQPNITTILKGNLVNAGNFYMNSGTLSLEKSSGTQDIQINTNDYFNSVRINTGGTVTISTSYFMQLKGSMNIQAGVLDPQNNTIALFGDWTNTVGTAGFEEGIGRVIFNGGNYHQFCSNETFFTLEVHKSVGGALRMSGANVNCSKYDWTSGAIDVLNNGTFTVSNQLLDNGIAGNFYINPGCTINLTNFTGNIDLKGNLYIYGGNFNVYGGVNPSWWPSGGNASITMSGGVLDFVDQGIVVKTDGTYTFTQNITGGTIRTSKDFTNGRSNFTPTGGEIEMYGSTNSLLTMTTGNLHNFSVNKNSGSQVTLNTNATVSGLLTIDGGTFATSNKTLNLLSHLDIQASGTLHLGAGSQTMFANAEYLNVFGNGILTAEGTQSQNAVLTSSSGFYFIRVFNNGTISAKHTTFQKLNNIHLLDGSNVDPANSFYKCTFTDNSSAYANMLIFANAQEIQIRDAHFPLLNSLYTISKPNNSGKLTFKDATGAYAGPDYEYDPYNRIDWVESQPGLWTGIASNDWNDPDNWDDLALPNSSASVVIPASAPNMPVLNSETAILVNDMTVLGTLTVGEANLITNFDCTISGSLVMSSGLTEQGYLQVLGDLNFESGSSASLTSTSDISVQKNLAFNSGSNVQIDNGRLILNGAFISQVINHSENTFIEKIVVDKSDSFYARFSDASTQHFYVNYLTLWDGSFLTAGDKHFVLNKDLDNTGGHISCTEGTFKLDGITQTLKLLPDDYFHHLVFSQTGTASLNTVNTSVLNVNGNLHIDSGVFDASGLTINIAGNWDNNVGPAAFSETGSRVIFNGGDYHQYLWDDETFDILEVDKPLGGALRMNNGPTIICNVYDWTAGAIDLGYDAEFVANDLAGGGIQGDYYINEDCSITLNCSSGNPDLNGNLHIFGGIFTIITPENTESNWPGNGNASLNMEGGELNVYPYGIEITDDSPYTFTSNITGGKIRTTGSFVNHRSDFAPVAGTIELYGENDVSLTMNTSSMGILHNVLIDKQVAAGKGGSVHVNENLLLNGRLKINNGRLNCNTGKMLVVLDSVNVNDGATLAFEPNSTFALYPGCSVLIFDGGTFESLGTESQPINVNRWGSSGYYNFGVAGTISSRFTVFDNCTSLIIGSSGYIDPDNAFYHCSFPNSNGLLLTINNSQTITLHGVNFPNLPLNFNVGKQYNTGYVIMKDATGAGAGADKEYDPFDRISWAVTQPGLWTGNVSSNWHNPENWDDLKVPTTSTDVIIPSGPANMPEVFSANAICQNLTLDGTLTINNEDFYVGSSSNNGNAVINGILVMKSSDRGYAPLRVYGTLTWNAGSEVDMQDLHTDIFVRDDLIFNEGANVNFDDGTVRLFGSENSQLIVNSENCSLNILVIEKNIGYSAQFSNSSTQTLFVGSLWISSNATFISESDQDIIIKRSIKNSGFGLQLNAGMCKLNGSTMILELQPGDYFNHLVFSHEGTTNFNTEHTSLLNVNGNLQIESGEFDATGLTVKVGGNWENNVGPEAFNESNSRVIFNGGDYHQYCHNETFNILEVDKSSGGLLYVNDVICQTYDWTAGGIITGVSKSFTAHDLADDGIYGSYNTGVSGTINLYQDENQSINIIGTLSIHGGTINIYGGNDQCDMGYAGNTVLDMTGGVLDVKNQHIYIIDNYPWVFQGTITGGTIRTSGWFTAQSPGFVPDGGTVEVYGEGNGFLFAQDGASFHNINIIKPYSYFNTPPHITILSSLVRNDFTIESGSVILQYDQTLECQGNFTVKDGGIIFLSSADLFMTNDKTLLIEEGGLIYTSGQETRKSRIAGVAPNDYFAVNVYGWLDCNQTIFSQMNEQGIYVVDGGRTGLSGTDLLEGKPGPNPLITVNSEDIISLYGVNFLQNTWGGQYNVRKINDAGKVFMLNASGPFSGEAFEDDPYGRIHWMPANHASDPQTVGNGAAICEDAFYTLTVADLVVESGGSADLIASHRIKILPGTHVMSGGNMHAWITETYEFCEQQPSMLASVSPADEEENSFLPAMRFASSDDQYHHLNIYPNPTSGIVNIELNGLNPDGKIILQVYGITGELREQFSYSGTGLFSVDLSAWNSGVYIIRVFEGNKSFSGKIIKQ